MRFDDQPDRPGDTRGSLDFLFEDFAREEFEFARGPEPADEWDFEEDQSRLTRVVSVMRAVAARLLWFGLAALLSLGSAGIVAATGRSPANDARPELTYQADQALSSRLDSAVRDLARLNDEVVYLGEMARHLLSDVSQLNQTRLDSDYQDGNATVTKIEVGAGKLKAGLSCEPWPADRDAELALTYSQTLIGRWHDVCTAIDSVKPLSDDWSAMTNGSKVVMQVTGDISQHDDAAAAALQLATQGRYSEALDKLKVAGAFLTDADRIATLMAKTGDVSTLQDWLGRTKDMDEALQVLWQTMIASKGRVTPQVTAALKNVNDAKALLPDDNSVLQVVIYELAGNLTASGISIENAKGQLASALANLTGVQPSDS